MIRIFVLLLVSGLALSCGFSEKREKAEAAAAQFHAELNASHTAAIYQSASDEFRAAGSESDVEAFLGAVRRKLGAFKSAQTSFVNVNATTAGTFVTLTLTSQWEQDSAVEDFTFLASESGLKLQHYNINSKTLVVK